jgi:hypothetical protein
VVFSSNSPPLPGILQALLKLDSRLIANGIERVRDISLRISNISDSSWRLRYGESFIASEFPLEKIQNVVVREPLASPDID